MNVNATIETLKEVFPGTSPREDNGDVKVTLRQFSSAHHQELAIKLGNVDYHVRRSGPGVVLIITNM